MKVVSVLTVVAVAAITMSASRVTAQDCAAIQALLKQGQTPLGIARATGLSVVDVQNCARAGHEPRIISPVGPPPHGAAGPAPLGAAGPPPHGAAGPAPHGAAGPAPFRER